MANVRGAVAAGEPSLLGWSVFLTVGVLAGAAVVARGPVRRPDGARLIRALAGGVLMGLGATIARGCNIGLGLAGLPTLSLGWALAAACMALAALAVRRLVLETRPGLRGIERPEPAGWSAAPADGTRPRGAEQYVRSLTRRTAASALPPAHPGPPASLR